METEHDVRNLAGECDGAKSKKVEERSKSELRANLVTATNPSQRKENCSVMIQYSPSSMSLDG